MGDVFVGNMLVRNGRLIDPSQNIDQIADILIENGKVVKIEEKITDHVDRVLEARGLTAVSYTHLDVYKRQWLPMPRTASAQRKLL